MSSWEGVEALPIAEAELTEEQQRLFHAAKCRFELFSRAAVVSYADLCLVNRVEPLRVELLGGYESMRNRIYYYHRQDARRQTITVFDVSFYGTLEKDMMVPDYLDFLLRFLELTPPDAAQFSELFALNLLTL